jgi:hypothetical protein
MRSYGGSNASDKLVLLANIPPRNSNESRHYYLYRRDELCQRELLSGPGCVLPSFRPGDPHFVVIGSI